MSVQYTGVVQYNGDVQCTGGGGAIISIVGGYHEYTGGHHDKCGEGHWENN